jgi:hypothetical protein
MGLVGKQFYSRKAVIYRYIPAPRQFYTGIILPPAVLFWGAVIFLYTGIVFCEKKHNLRN